MTVHDQTSVLGEGEAEPVVFPAGASSSPSPPIPWRLLADRFRERAFIEEVKAETALSVLTGRDRVRWEKRLGHANRLRGYAAGCDRRADEQDRELLALARAVEVI